MIEVIHRLSTRFCKGLLVLERTPGPLVQLNVVSCSEGTLLQTGENTDASIAAAEEIIRFFQDFIDAATSPPSPDRKQSS
jgi:hypothetical protein